MYLLEAGLYHYKARAYHPEIGRFMQTDPIGYGDGLNMYAYVQNDPVNGSDPMGLARRGRPEVPASKYTWRDVYRSWRTCQTQPGETICRTGGRFFGGNAAAFWAGLANGSTGINRPEINGGGGGGNGRDRDQGKPGCNQALVDIGNVIVASGEAATYAASLLGTLGVAIAVAGIPIPEPFIESFGLGVAGIGFGIAAISEGVSFVGASVQGFGKGGFGGAADAVKSRASALTPLLGRFGPAGKAAESALSAAGVAKNVLEPSFSPPETCKS